MSYRQGNNPNATSGADWQYSGAQVDPTTNDQTSSGQQYGTNRTQDFGQTTQSSQQPAGSYSTHSNVTGNTGQQYGTSQQYGDPQQTSDFGSTGQTQSGGYGQPRQQASGYNSNQQGLSSQDPTSQQYDRSSSQQYGQDVSNQQYGQPQSQSYGQQHNPSLGEKVKGNFEKMAGQLQGDTQKVAEGEARAKGLDPSLQ